MSDRILFCRTFPAGAGHGLARLVALLAGLGLASCGGRGGSALGSDEPLSTLDAPTSKKVDAILAELTLDDKIALVTGAAKASTDPILSAGYTVPIKHGGVDIPALYLGDSPNGVGNGNTGVTQFPTAISVAATWDVEMARAYGDALGAEWAGKAENVGLGPGINIDRLPYNGRTPEYYSEDPYLAGQIAASEIRGIQGRHVIATAKHYLLNNQEIDRNSVSVVVSERATREIYLPAFEAAVKQGGAGAIMCSYNRIGGTYACEHPHFLTEVLRGDWGFTGFVMSDWGANHSTAASALAGLDMEMPGTGLAAFIPSYYGPALEAAVQNGTVPEARLDAMVRHILVPMMRVGLFDHRHTTPLADVSTPAHRALARRISEEGSVLLKNAGGVLPLPRTARVVVIGPAADAFPQSGIGGSGAVNPSAPVVTPLAGIKAAIGGANVTYAQGSVGSGSLPVLTALHAASGATVGNADLVTATGSGVPGFSETITDSSGHALDGDVIYAVDYGLCLAFLGPCTNNSWPTTPANLTDGSVRGWKAEYRGVLRVAAAKSYQFSITGSGDTRLFIDGNLVAQVTSTTSDTRSFSITLDASANGHAIDLVMDTSSYGWPSLFGFFTQPPTLKLAWNPAGDMMQDAIAVARGASVALVFASDAESEGVDHGLSLPGDQDELIANVAAVAQKTVVVLNTGSALVLPWIDRVDAVLENWYGGQELGTAIAALLFGDASPSGKSVVTFPASEAQLYARNASQYPGIQAAGATFPSVYYDEGLLVGYRWFDQTREEPLFPFGHGLSYTTFAYGHLRVSPDHGDGTSVTVKARVRNTGMRAGAEVAQLYVGFPVSAGEPPRQLKAFRKVSLAPGKGAELTFKLDSRAFSYWDEATGKWSIAPGEYRILVGSSSRDIRLAGTFTVPGSRGGPAERFR